MCIFRIAQKTIILLHDIFIFHHNRLNHVEKSPRNHQEWSSWFHQVDWTSWICSLSLNAFSVCPLGFIMLTQPCSLWPICQTPLALSTCSDLDLAWIAAPADRMMATSAPVWKALRVCPADPLALSHPQANHSQSQGCRGEVSEESQHLIGELQWVRFFIFFPFQVGSALQHIRPSRTVGKN